MILGTAASNSITKDSGVLILDDAISDRNTATPKLIGTPTAIAKAEVISVPIMYGKAPYDSLPSTEFQSVPVKKPKPSRENIFIEPFPTAIATSASMNKVKPAAPMTML